MAINAKMNQVKSCNKYLQFVMDDNDVELKYDKQRAFHQISMFIMPRRFIMITKTGTKNLLNGARAKAIIMLQRTVLSNSILWCLHIMTIQARLSM